VASVVWTPDSGLTVSDETLYGQVATANIAVASSVADGTDLGVTLTATLADGNTLIARVMLPVRIPSLDCPC
jgi:hypothetical protein